MIEDMVRRAEFRFDDAVEIEVPNQLIATTICLALHERRAFEPELYPISGFPRCLIMEDTVNATRLDKRAEIIRRRRHGALDVANDPQVMSISEEAPSRTNAGEPDIEDAATLVETDSSDGVVVVSPTKDNPTHGNSEDKEWAFSVRSKTHPPQPSGVSG
jgi:hypothetical protein